MNRPVYLDCAATTPPDPRVVELMQHYLMVEFGNQGSRTHDYGSRARQAVEHARDQIASVAGARRSEVIFTSGATEANNLAILGASQERGHIVTTAIEHPAVLEPIAELERRGLEVTRVTPAAGGWVTAASVLEAIRPDTFLVSVMHVNNETGVIQPIAEIADGLCDSRALFHVDAAQGFGKLVAPLQHPRIDLIGISGHKIGGPQGIGALIARRRDPELTLRPLMFGGEQERGLRPGTLPAHLIAGLGLAAELAASEAAPRARHAAEFRAQVLSGLAATHYEVNGGLEHSSPYILNLSFRGLDGEQVIDAWSEFAAVSNGAACASQQKHCSHVLAAMGIGGERAAGAVRLSWCERTPLPDLAAMVQAVESISASHARIA
jgi:cysteine desulfurase